MHCNFILNESVFVAKDKEIDKMVLSDSSANGLYHLQPKRNSHVVGFLASCVVRNNDGI